MKRCGAFLRSSLPTNFCGFSTISTRFFFFISVVWKLLRVLCSFLIIQVVPEDPHWDQGLSQPGLWPCGKIHVLSTQGSGKTGLEWAWIIKVCKQMMMGNILELSPWFMRQGLWEAWKSNTISREAAGKQSNTGVIYSWHMKCVSSLAVCELSGVLKLYKNSILYS